MNDNIIQGARHTRNCVSITRRAPSNWWRPQALLAGYTYLGTQGDEFDAQEDMALATSGSVLVMLLLRLKSALNARRVKRPDQCQNGAPGRAQNQAEAP